jgi:hypothetical protein
MLMSSSGFGGQTKKQERAMAMLQSQSIEPELMDGSDPTNREQRNRFFEMRGMGGNYPQFFLKEQDGKTYFAGDFDTIERCNDEVVLGVAEECLKSHCTYYATRNGRRNLRKIESVRIVARVHFGQKLLTFVQPKVGD